MNVAEMITMAMMMTVVVDDIYVSDGVGIYCYDDDDDDDDDDNDDDDDDI